MEFQRFCMYVKLWLALVETILVFHFSVLKIFTEILLFPFLTTLPLLPAQLFALYVPLVLFVEMSISAEALFKKIISSKKALCELKTWQLMSLKIITYSCCLCTYGSFYFLFCCVLREIVAIRSTLALGMRCQFFYVV